MTRIKPPVSPAPATDRSQPANRPELVAGHAPKTSALRWIGEHLRDAVEDLKPSHVVNTLREKLDGLSDRDIAAVLKDKTIQPHEAWVLVDRARDFGGVTSKERTVLTNLLRDHGSEFHPAAREALQAFLDAGAPSAKAPVPPELAALWKSGPWDRQSYFPPPGYVQPSATDALAHGKAVFPFSVEQGKREADEVAKFFDAYPSIGGKQVAAFHNMWASFESFDKKPLQAFLYHSTRPIDDAGNPRGPLWNAYVDAVKSGLPASTVEEAYLRAHIADFKAMLADPKFKELYSVADPDMRGMVEAYIDTLQKTEARLDRGEDPVSVARGFFPETMLCLQDRGVSQWVWTPKILGNLFSQNTKNAVKAYADVGKAMVGLPLSKPRATQLSVTLNAKEAAALSAETGLPFRAGVQTLKPEQFKNAFFTEPDRRADLSTPPPKIPLRFEDFLAPQKIHKGLGAAGADGVFSYDEIRGVLRDLQARARSSAIDAFNRKYPCPENGILVYSANMLAMNQSYGQSEMFGALASAIMPVDQNGKPKNALWQRYVDANESHQKTGAPSDRQVELYWLAAHMNDFKVVDTPDFQKKLNAFWAAAAKDPALQPMAIYTQAMVLGRQEYEKARANGMSDEAAFTVSLEHFARTMAEHKTFPFWQQDLKEGMKWLTDSRYRNGPDADDRGLATDKAMLERTVGGLKEMVGLVSIAKSGALERIRGETDVGAATKLVDLAQVLSPSELAQVDPKVIDFYREPLAYDATASVSLPSYKRVGLSGIVSLLTGQGQIPDRVRGAENFPMEMELYKDDKGATHWDRYVVVDGSRKTLFKARFEPVGNQLRETFKLDGQDVALYFDVKPYQGGVKLTLDRSKSAGITQLANITFTTVPGANGVKTVGMFDDRAVPDQPATVDIELRRRIGS